MDAGEKVATSKAHFDALTNGCEGVCPRFGTASKRATDRMALHYRFCAGKAPLAANSGGGVAIKRISFLMF
jgi:hypothetical protein